MKNIIFILLLITLFAFQIFPQEYNGDQLILSYLGNSEITFKILDFETNEPIIGAEIFSKDLNKVLSITDVDGITTIQKFISQNFRIDYIGYDSYCFKLTDTSVDFIVVRLLLMELDYGHKVVNRKGDSLGYSRNIDAIKDIEMEKFQLLRYTDPSLEQNKVAQEFGFTFQKYTGNNSGYIYSYNEEVLNHLSKKYQVDLRSRLLEVCWYNKHFFK